MNSNDQNKQKISKKKERIVYTVVFFIAIGIVVFWSFILRERFSKKVDLIEIKENFSILEKK
ncbi:MAG: hypothetical protein ACI9AR_000367 [Flavobacteriaceae bacterium]|jgi:hypothetical protein